MGHFLGYTTIASTIFQAAAPSLWSLHTFNLLRGDNPGAKTEVFHALVNIESFGNFASITCRLLG